MYPLLVSSFVNPSAELLLSAESVRMIIKIWSTREYAASKPFWDTFLETWLHQVGSLTSAATDDRLRARHPAVAD